jgi:hypothetical protein
MYTMTGSVPALSTGLMMRIRASPKGGRDSDPLLVEGELVDGLGLQVVEHFARLGGLELVEERWL